MATAGGGVGYLLKDRVSRVDEFVDIAHQLVITDNAVHKHIGNIFAKLGLAVADSGHRRVLAVLAYLNGR